MRWHEDPPRQSLRMLALAAEAQQRAGQPQVDRHVVVLEEPQVQGGMPMATMLWSKQPFSAEALQRLRRAVTERQEIGPVAILCWPGEQHDNELSRFLRCPDRDAFLAAYPYDATPTTDDRPFFFHTARLVAGRDDGVADDSNEQAVAVLRTVLTTVLVITLLAFAGPFVWALWRRRLGGARATALRLSYFAALGVGFMLVEIPLLQRFGLYMGHPAWSLGVVLGALLLGAGCGGLQASRVPFAATRRALRIALATIVVLLVLLALLTPPLLDATLRWSFAARALVTATVLLPVGAALGAALPLGVRLLHGSAAELVPWAWGINGVTSVFASVLAVVIGMQFGFTAALATGIGCYLVATALAGALPQSGPAVE
jgi:hypothetical protein